MSVEAKKAKKGPKNAKNKNLKKNNKKPFKKTAKPKKVAPKVDFSNISSDEDEIVDKDILDIEDDDEGNYDGFMEGMASLEGSKRFLHPTQVQDQEDDEFEYGVASRTSVESLLSAVADKKTKKAIRKSYSDQVDKHKDLKIRSSISTPEQEKVDRMATYQRSQKELAKWDAVVHSRRGAPSLQYPLVKPDVKVITSSHHYETKFEAKTPLEAEVMSLLSNSTAVVKPNEELSAREKSLLDKMTMREAMEKRKELMKLRSLQSYQEQKIRRQNKIKSKKYRKILRKEKQKDKLKELELLHATNPELAAERLEEMEKIRIQERATLKHRNASKYLQFQAIRSKNNSESREIVQEQLRKHRELTTKLDKATIDSDEEDVEEDSLSMKLSKSEPSDNPWIQSGTTKEKEVNKDGETFDEFTASYKKFWSTASHEKDDADDKNSVQEEKEEEVETIEDDQVHESSEETTNCKRKLEDDTPTQSKEAKRLKDDEENGTPVKTPESKQKKKRKRETPNKESPPKKKVQLDNKKNKSINEKNAKKLEMKTASIEKRERLEMAETIDDLFCEAQSLVREKLEKKMKKINANLSGKEEDIDKDEEDKAEADESLAHAESLHFETDHDHHVKVEDKPKNAKKAKNAKNIDPSNFIKVKKNIKQTQIKDPEMEMVDEDEEEGIRKVIAEAFADDDVIEKDFKAEKDAIIEANQPKVINKVLPGWGSWGGENIKVSKRKIKRFTFKAPPAPVRKDANKGHLILNEDKNNAIKSHQVSSVPFPFRTVKDYEASIRTPVGETFVPRTVFKKLTKPKTKTSAGVLIEPMDKEELVKRGLLKDDLKVET